MIKTAIPPMYGWAQSGATQVFQIGHADDDGNFNYVNYHNHNPPSSTYNSDSDSANPAKASVTREPDSEDGSNWKKAYFRFLNVSVAQGATIKNAYLKVIISAASGTDVATVVGTDDDNVARPTSGASGSHSLHTSASVAWSNPTASGTNYVSSPDIKTIVQEIVNRSGWSSGSAMMIQVYYQSSVTGNQSRSFLQWDTNSNNSQAAKLEIST